MEISIQLNAEKDPHFLDERKILRRDFEMINFATSNPLKSTRNYLR